MYNRCILIGRLTRDPELKQTPNGISVTSFSIAVDRPRTRDKTDFLGIVAWRNTAEFVCRYFSKGKAILVEGSIQTRSYTDSNGKNRTVYEVVADSVSFVENKNANSGSDTKAPAPAYSNGNPEDFAELGDDDDLPF